jgi:hypothetical protein
VHAHGPYGGGTAVRGPYGGGAVRGYGPYGAGGAVRGPYGGVAYGHARYGRPYLAGPAFYGYQRRFYGYPGWRSYGLSYGLVGPLVGISSLAFLSAGLLVGSFVDQGQTVYVYVVQEDGRDVEYRVLGDGTVLSRRELQ